jgi:hypothetical protein
LIYPETASDETQINGADVKVNGTDDTDSHAPLASSQKYSQILGDHHTNSSNHYTKNSNHIYKPRSSYNNKENFYNQRSGGRANGGQRSWQRSGGYRTPTVNGKDRRADEYDKPHSNDGKLDSTSEPIKFNEGKLTDADVEGLN